MREPNLHRHGRRRKPLGGQRRPSGARVPYGGGGDVEFGAQGEYELEAGGVVLHRDFVRGGAAGRAWRGLARGHRAGVRFHQLVHVVDLVEIVSGVRFTGQEEGNAWEGCGVLRGARETASYAWVAQHAPSSPKALAEFERRVASLRDGDETVRWHSF